MGLLSDLISRDGNDRDPSKNCVNPRSDASNKNFVISEPPEHIKRKYGLASGIKPIETNYKGYRFRSRLEARWAVALDSCPLSWDYEREGFQLPSGKYLPDFWIDIPTQWANSGNWLEIKPFKPNETEIRLCSELAVMTGHHSLIAYGNFNSGFECISFMRCTGVMFPDYMDAGPEFSMRCLFDQAGGDWEKAKLAARSVRFEHGESPR